MSKFVSFSVTDGGVVGKARKRLRGDPNRKPEIKKCGFAGTSANPIMTCVCNYLNNVPSAQQSNFYLYNHNPTRIAYPSQGTTSASYVGSSIFLKFFRFKGYLLNLATNPVQIRWRLCLIRIDWSGIDTTQFGTSEYLNLFKSTTVSQPISMTTVAAAVTGAARNYYGKQKDVDEWASIKRVVIASGVLPPGNTYHWSTGSMAGGSVSLETGHDLNSDGAGYRGYTPIDVKVTLNDRVNVSKDLVRYYLVFESDCGLAYVPATGNDPRVNPALDTPTYSPIQISFQATTYYTDA